MKRTVSVCAWLCRDRTCIIPDKLQAVAGRVAQYLVQYPHLKMRVSADVPGVKPGPELWRQSLELSRAVSVAATRRGVADDRIDQWGWGASRSLTPTDPTASIKLGVMIELFQDQSTLKRMTNYLERVANMVYVSPTKAGSEVSAACHSNAERARCRFCYNSVACWLST